MFKFLSIDTEKNVLLCSTELVGVGELTELHVSGDATPMQINGKILKKVADPNLFEVKQAYESQEFVGKQYSVGPDCVFRILMRNISGSRRRRFSDDEKKIINTENDGDFEDKKVVKAKTGSVRSRKKKKKKAAKKSGKKAGKKKKR
jgi:hypothetical protein